MARKKWDKKKAMGWFIIIVMVLSMGGLFGASFFTEDSSTQTNFEEYNGFRFYRQYAQWRLTLGEQDYAFSYLPTDLENFTLPINPGIWYGSEKVYLASLPNDTLDTKSFFNLLSAVFYANNVRPQEACTEEENCGDIPIMDCGTNQGVVMQSGEKFSISSNDNCLVVEAIDVLELQRITERIIYGFLGVMG